MRKKHISHQQVGKLNTLIFEFPNDTRQTMYTNVIRWNEERAQHKQIVSRIAMKREQQQQQQLKRKNIFQAQKCMQTVV